MKILEIGKVYKPKELIVSLELNLEDLYWVQSLVPYSDGFRKDIQDGIDAIEKRNRLLSEWGNHGVGIVVVTEVK